MSNNKQSSVEWLYEKLFHCEINIFEWQNYLEQAKAMHKKEIVKAYNHAYEEGWDSNDWNPEDYYNKTFSTKDK